MLGLPWWAWLLLGLVAFLWIAFLAARSWRRTIRLEFMEFLRQEAPEVEILTELEHELAVMVRGGGDGTLRLDRLYREGSRLKPEDTAGRKDLFNRLLAVLRESPDIGRLESEEDRRRILPRLVTDSFLRQIRAEMSGEVLPALPLGVPGLSVVLVLDGETAVAYLSEGQLSAIGLTPEEGLELARQNLARSFESAIVRRALTDGSLNVVKAGDSFDAARLLLVPGALAPGEQVVALIPDRDTLVVTSVPKDGNWSGLRKLARAAAGEPLWTEPLVVTADGVSTIRP
jgi:hypothetical protein